MITVHDVREHYKVRVVQALMIGALIGYAIGMGLGMYIGVSWY